MGIVARFWALPGWLQLVIAVAVDLAIVLGAGAGIAWLVIISTR